MFNSSNSLSFPFFDPLSRVLRSIFSCNGNVLVAALISLVLVTIFVLVLHIYAKWFLAQAQRRRRRSITVSQVLSQPRFHHFHSLALDSTPAFSSPTKGLDASVIATIPVFIYTPEMENQCETELECVICLSAFEEREIGRSLHKCKHVFHVECIDMWLRSHSNCPICRAPAVRELPLSDENSRNGTGDQLESSVIDEGALQIVIAEQRC